MILDRRSFVLTLTCPDAVGIVANVTAKLAGHGALITEAQHFRDPVSNSSILRIVFEAGRCASLEIQRIEEDLAEVAVGLRMSWKIHDSARRLRVLIAVSKHGHCLNSLLYRWSEGTLSIDIVGVASNHDSQRGVVEWHGVPFHHLPIEPHGKSVQQRELLDLFRTLNCDLLILARYMQILSGELCHELHGRAINIHHSFLPGFKGARPYHQAHARGVKLIGATAHYVNTELDEGPIIEQAVERVDHTMNVQQLTTFGNEIESVVLNRAVQWHAEHRIFTFDNRTVVLR